MDVPRSPKHVSPSQKKSQPSPIYTLPTERTHVASDSVSGKQSSDLPASYQVRQMFYDKYEMGKILGRGASAEVYVVKEKASGVSFACKVIHRDNRMNDSLTMGTEMLVLQHVQHAHLVCLHELFDTRDTLFLVLQLADGGDLIDALVHQSSYTEDVVRDIFRQLLEAVAYLHDLGIVHRDLKLDNILFSKDPSNLVSGISVKITDFGLSAVLDKQRFSSPAAQSKPLTDLQQKKEKSLTQMWGTTEYFAPEVFARAYGRQADVWALGCVLYEMLTGELAFPYRETPVPLMERLLFNGGKKAPRMFERKTGWQRLSPSAQHLIRQMLKVRPEKRLSVRECLSHPWLQSSAPAGQKMKQVDSSCSLDCCDASSITTLSPSCSTTSLHSASQSPVSDIAGPSSRPATPTEGSYGSVSGAVELSDALKVLKERVDRRARRYRNLVAEVAHRNQVLVAAAAAAK